MKRNYFWKVLLILFVLAWSLKELYPPTDQDLFQAFRDRAANTDSNFTAIVERTRKLRLEGSLNTYANLTNAIGTNDITRYFKSIKVPVDADPTRAILNRVQADAAGRIKLGLDLKGGTMFMVEADTTRLDKSSDRERVLSQAVEVLRRRVDKLGVAEPTIQPAGQNRIMISLPGLSESANAEARSTLEKAAFLEFRMVHPQSKDLIDAGIPEPGYEVLSLKPKKSAAQEMRVRYLVKKTAEMGLTGKNIKQAMVVRDPMSNQPQIDFTLDSKGADLFAQVTRDNIGHQLAIVLDGELYSAPVIQGEIPGGRGQITGTFDLAEAFELANVLENPLETPVRIIEERRVDPSLGRDSIRSGIIAAVVGVVSVVVFMLIYYLFAGVVANLALILNVIILMGVMCSVGTTLTIPGIAGIVLTIGMAVDANVLIYERIREELAAGKSMRGALSAGYDKAFGTIFDSNLTTLISSVILIFMGTGPVKGFGVTLTIGVTVSMFTALVVTRLIFDWLLDKGFLKNLRMLHLVKGAHYDFMAFAKPAFAISWTLIVIGCGYGVYRGHDLLGVDFAGGDTLVLSFDQSQKPNLGVDKLREAVAKTGITESFIQFQTELAKGRDTLRVTVPYNTGGKVEAGLKQQFPQAKFERLSLDNVGPSVGVEIRKTAIIASLLAMFGILIYVAMRYEFSFAVGAVIAIIHDILMTMGWFSLTGRQFSAPMVAAILTIIGFSINDTIVIFDRIREDLKLGVRGTFREVMNKALNQTLSRTIITSGTVFLATASLYLFGGGVINDFAFTFLVGIVTGTYSSIYIASALVLWWHKGERPKMSASQVSVENSQNAEARV